MEGADSKKRHSFTIAQRGQRLDICLAVLLPNLSRAAVQRLIRQGHVRHNGEAGKPGARVEAGDVVDVTLPSPATASPAPQDLGLRVLYEDSDILVVDKPAGLAVHPAAGHPDGTLVNALLAHTAALSHLGGPERPGIVHRLDKDTSGLLLVARNDPAHRELARQFKEREMEKIYIALVRGYPRPTEGVIDAAIGRDPRHRRRMAVMEWGREARTTYRVLATFTGSALVEARPESGRTHQVRVHLAALGHPVVGDALYGGRSPLLGRQFLHARRLAFRHPSSGEVATFKSPLPPELAQVLQEAAGEDTGTLDALAWLL